MTQFNIGRHIQIKVNKYKFIEVETRLYTFKFYRGLKSVSKEISIKSGFLTKKWSLYGKGVRSNSEYKD